MVQKRYQYYSKEGKVWTKWFNYCEDDDKLQTLQEEEKWQLKNKLLNQFRII